MSEADLGTEIPLAFPCGDDILIGILHLPEQLATTGLIIVVGGPQYRAGSHRLFVSVARKAMAKGFPTLRFDCRGMGDASGQFSGFEAIVPDIEAAVTALTKAVPSISKIALWGLCDASLAISMYAAEDRRIAGITILNPWVRTDSDPAPTNLKNYYTFRIMGLLRSQQTFSLKPYKVIASLGSFLRYLWMTFREDKKDKITDQPLLAERMAAAIVRFGRRVLVVVSGRDLTAQEFNNATKNSNAWAKIFGSGRTERLDIPEADHTFSEKRWSEELSGRTVIWLEQLGEDSMSSENAEFHVKKH